MLWVEDTKCLNEPLGGQINSDMGRDNRYITKKEQEMITVNKGRVLTAVMILICLGAAQIACGLFSGQGADSSDLSEVQQPYSGEDSQVESSESAQSEDGDPLDEQGESPVEPALDSDTLPCPLKGSTLYLGFDHALTVNYEDTSIHHFLHQGWLELKVIDDAGTIVSEGSPALTYSMEGKMSDECALTAEGTMTPSAHGSCEAGVVSLFIQENWMALEGEMQCIDSDGDVVILPFNVPPMGLQEHNGENDTGEIFYLVEGSEGYSTMRPFLEGEGYHTWTLYTEEIPLVPLVPED